MSPKAHRELKVWQRSMQLVTNVYQASRLFPKEELYGLTSQLRRAVVSIPANIAEGNARSTPSDYAHFIAIARGSLAEVETLLTVALQLGYGSSEVLQKLLDESNELGRMLTAMYGKVSQWQRSGQKQQTLEGRSTRN